MPLPDPQKISRPEDEPPYLYRAQGRGREWTITVGSILEEPAPREVGVVEVRTSACPTCGAVSSALGYLSVREGLPRRRWRRQGLAVDHGMARRQERVVPGPSTLIVRGYPPEECPGCGSRLRFDLGSLDFEKAFQMCKEGGIVDIEALPWEV